MNTNVLTPETADQTRDMVAWAVAHSMPLNVQGHGSKSGLGRAVDIGTTLDLSHLSGITEYNAPELVLTARAGTPCPTFTPHWPRPASI